MTCSVVVGGSGLGEAGLTVDCPLARVEVGPTVMAASAPIEIRLARELAGTKRSWAARRRARERPSDSCQGSDSARSRASRRWIPVSISAEAGATLLALRRARPRPARARRARERSSEALQG